MASSANAGEFIQVTGWGKTEDAARQNAFIKAIELEMGVMMLSDRDTKNNVQVKNNIYAYSAGFVEDYNVVSVNPTDTGVFVTVDVKVSSSKIKNQILLSVGKTGNLNGDLAAARYNTYKHTRDSADAILTKFVSGYPEQAYKVDITKIDVKSGSNRQPILDIEFSIALDKKFITGFADVMSVMENPKSKSYTTKVVFDKWEFLPILDHRDTFFVEDSVTQEILYTYINPSTVRVNISLNGNDGVLYSVCRSVDTFVKVTNDKMTLFVGQTKYFGTQITDRNMAGILENITSVTLSTVKSKDCKK